MEFKKSIRTFKYKCFFFFFDNKDKIKLLNEEAKKMFNYELMQCYYDSDFYEGWFINPPPKFFELTIKKNNTIYYLKCKFYPKDNYDNFNVDIEEYYEIE